MGAPESGPVDCLIVGGGIAGLTAARELSRLGHSVMIAEMADHLGGHVAHYYNLFPIQTLAVDVVKPLVDEVTRSPQVRTLLRSEVIGAAGRFGEFSITTRDPSGQHTHHAKTLILATGFEIYDMANHVFEYNYSKHPNILTGSELERIALGEHGRGGGGPQGTVTRPSDGRVPESVSFVLCVGSRDETNNVWCCEVGCKVAINQALHVKEVLGPDVTVTVCLIDIRAHGRLSEEMYRRCRDKGVTFLRGRPSSIDLLDEHFLSLKVFDQVTQKLLEVRADLVVLEPTLVPRSGTVLLSEQLRIPVGADGFFETQDYFAPVTTATDGLYVAGCTSGTRDIPATMSHAGLAAVNVAARLRGH